ncbi:DUF3352 domain-containing protein [Ornithinimicrobium sp. F0845]|uniref:DUF3352 domain-containing protein n=1 Tax=Ornithinimicrobium sp. F0845 TaxID=2926412 RepID=UPI001FF6CE68|nr:DUF3352 domain-containing protein [Ornithinimicrobium sp. F0845]MCK0113730.1 DUF3352 domain-containing protein [Ornithinimicrobium sp. F0845]
MTAPPAGTFDAPDGGVSYTYEPPTQGSKNRPALLVALAVVAALVIGGGAWAVTRSLGGGGDQPASALPADTAAYVRLDIDPAVGQKIAAVRFFQGLDDDVLETLRDDDIRAKAFEWMASEDEAFAAVNYEEDIEPWLGDRLALGIVPNGSDTPYFGIALQVKDEDAANEGLTKLQEATNATESDPAEGLDWYFHGDYAVLTTTGTVGTMQDLTEAGTLADKDTFREDMGALGDEGVLSAWVDIEPLATLADSPLAEQSLDNAAALDPSGALGSMAGTSQLAERAATGRFAAAVRFSEDSIEVGGVTRGMDGIGVEGGDSGRLVLDLPEDTVAAFSLEHGDQYVAHAYELLKSEFPDDFAEVEAQASEAGFTIPGDIQTLVGSSLVLSVGPGILGLQDDLEDFNAWEIAYRTETDTDAAEDLLTRLFEMTGEPEIQQFLTQRSDDGVLTLGVSQPYVNTVAEAGSLGDFEAFKSAVPNAADADSVFYVNVNTFEHLYLEEIDDSEAREALELLGAVGYSASSDAEGNGDFTFRLVADD